MVSSDAAFFNVWSMAGSDRRLDVVDRMKAGHERLRFLMARLRHSRASAPDRRRLFDMLCDAVEAHGAAAEQSFYAGLMARTKDQRLAQRAVEVHDEAALLIGELSDMAMADAAWQAGLGDLAELLEDHFRVEEGEIFALAKALFDGEQANQLGDKYERAWRQWIEIFGRVPAASEALSVPRSGFLDRVEDLVGRNAKSCGHPAAWLERLRWPLRAARPPRSTAVE